MQSSSPADASGARPHMHAMGMHTRAPSDAAPTNKEHVFSPQELASAATKAPLQV